MHTQSPLVHSSYVQYQWSNYACKRNISHNQMAQNQTASSNMVVLYSSSHPSQVQCRNSRELSPTQSETCNIHHSNHHTVSSRLFTTQPFTCTYFVQFTYIVFSSIHLQKTHNNRSILLMPMMQGSEEWMLWTATHCSSEWTPDPGLTYLSKITGSL